MRINSLAFGKDFKSNFIYRHFYKIEDFQILSFEENLERQLLYSKKFKFRKINILKKKKKAWEKGTFRKLFSGTTFSGKKSFRKM